MEEEPISKELESSAFLSEAAAKPFNIKALPHALLIPYPCQGHLNPFLELAFRLSSLGFITTLVTIDAFVPRFASSHSISKQTGSLIKQVQVPSHDNKSFVSIVGIPDGLPPNQDRDFVDIHIGLAVQNNLEEAVLELVHSLACDGRPVTYLFGDFFISWIPHLAHVLNLPEIVVWPQNASCFAIYSHVDLLISNGYNPFEGNAHPFGSKEAMDLVSCIPGVPPIHPSELPFETGIGKVGLDFLESITSIRFKGLHKAVAFLGNTFTELEQKVCEALHPNFVPIGPLIPASILESNLQNGNSTGPKHVSSRASLWAEDECISWLDKQPSQSVVYVSFGSLTKYSMDQIQELAKGLVSSNQRFLWVIRKNMMLGETGEVLEALPKGFLEEIKGRGKVIKWAPQARVLAHPSVGGFFSHCGWNSCIEALTFGVPILGWPFMVDQITNCWLVCNQWKVGLKVETNRENFVCCTEVERCLKDLMAGEDALSMRARATKLKHAAQLSIFDSLSQSDHLKHFVTSLHV